MLLSVYFHQLFTQYVEHTSMFQIYGTTYVYCIFLLVTLCSGSEKQDKENVTSLLVWDAFVEIICSWVLLMALTLNGKQSSVAGE